MTDLFQQPEDATPLNPGEQDVLLQSWITSRNDLNEAERDNIVKGAAWARRRRSQTAADLLSDDFAKTLHKRMFGEVWKWAGTYRQTERNIEIEAYRISAETPAMFADARYWVDNTMYPPDEIAVRLHHRLVVISPVPQRQRTARAPDGRSADRTPGRPTLRLGRGQSCRCRHTTRTLCGGAAGGRWS